MHFALGVLVGWTLYLGWLLVEAGANDGAFWPMVAAIVVPWALFAVAWRIRTGIESRRAGPVRTTVLDRRAILAPIFLGAIAGIILGATGTFALLYVLTLTSPSP